MGKVWATAALFGLLGAAGALAANDTPTISATPVPFHQTDLDKTRQGHLTYLGGFELNADAEWFGGWSGMAMSRDGTRVRLISDKAHWADLVLNPDQTGVPQSLVLSGHGQLDVGPIGMFGRRSNEVDAEEVVDLSGLGDLSGPFLVSYERNDRILRYQKLNSAPTVFFKPPNLIPNNKGMEAVVRLNNGQVLALTEAARDGGGNGIGWLLSGDGTVVTPITYAVDGAFEPTAAAQMPGGDILLLERRYSRLTGVAIQLRRMPLAHLSNGHLEGPVIARLGGAYTIDNFEAMALRQLPNGALHLYVISDDNFNAVQRTLFMIYSLDWQTK